MVPASYHEFFSATAEVAGTLIGLLFVASSLSPDKLRGADSDYQVRAGVAYTALTNALVIGLIALIPGTMAVGAIVLSIGGLSSAAAMGVVSFRHARLHHRVRSFTRVAALVLLFAIQLVYAVDLNFHTHRTSPIEAFSYVIVSSFLFAIERSWELLGGDGAGIVALAARSLVRRSQAARAGSEDDPPDGVTPPS